MFGTTDCPTDDANQPNERSEGMNGVWAKALALAKAATREHTQKGPFPDKIKQAVRLQDEYNLDEESEKIDLSAWIARQVDSDIVVHLSGRRHKTLEFDTVSVSVTDEEPLFEAACQPSALRVLMNGMSSQEYQSFAEAITGDTNRFSVNVRGDPEAGTLSRTLEIVLLPDSLTPNDQGDGVEDSGKKFSVVLPLTAAAMGYYRRVYYGAKTTRDGSLIPRAFPSLESFPRRKVAMAAVEALQKSSQEFIGDSDPVLLRLIRLQDMISLAGPVCTGQLDPFELFTDEERRVGEELASLGQLDKSLAKQRKWHSHWSGLMTSDAIHSVATLLEAGESVFIAKTRLEDGAQGESVMKRKLNVYAYPDSVGHRSVECMNVFVSKYIADQMGGAHFAPQQVKRPSSCYTWGPITLHSG